MKIYKDEIQITRGETWNFDVQLTNSTGGPYIISKEFRHPYFLITVASTKFPVEDRIVRNYWCKIDTDKRFYRTTACEIDPAKLIEVSPQDKIEMQNILRAAGFDLTLIPNEFQNQVVTMSRLCVFKTIEDGVEKYWYYEKLQGDARFKPKEYTCGFAATFTSNDTIEWIEQEYSFALKLVDLLDDPKDANKTLPLEQYDPLTDRPDVGKIFDAELDKYVPYTKKCIFMANFRVPSLIKVSSSLGSLIQEE